MSVGQIIRELRRERKITQEELGKILNLGKSTISQYENDINKPDSDMLKLIADFFNTSVDYLLGRTKIKEPLELINKELPTKAYHNLDQSGLPEEAIKQIEDYVDFVKQKYNKDGSLKEKK